VKIGENGEIAVERTKEKLSEAMDLCFENLRSYSGASSLKVAAEYTPAKVLEPVYMNYRRLAGRS
jgi:hypothetical protein